MLVLRMDTSYTVHLLARSGAPGGCRRSEVVVPAVGRSALSRTRGSRPPAPRGRVPRRAWRVPAPRTDLAPTARSRGGGHPASPEAWGTAPHRGHARRGGRGTRGER